MTHQTHTPSRDDHDDTHHHHDGRHDTRAHVAAGAFGLPAPGCVACTGHFTRREHLTHDVVIAGAAITTANEVVSAAGSTRPDWKMDELLTTAEWAAR
ncbi:MAG: hypothetical protein JWN84_4531 [Nocardioides sp.]|jgi:hypothetical protein|nr:hypothetical protein [Nocardioides sp.]